MEKRVLKDLSALFGRVFSLLLNRSLMYQPGHPVIKQSVVDVHKTAARLLDEVSPLVFILDRGNFFVDEEPLDPRINIHRVAALFKRCGLQSVSFEKGLTESELNIFAELFSSLVSVANAEEVKTSLYQKGVFNIKINHVTFRKVTEDDQVVSREALKKVTPMMDADDKESRQRFMETLLESVLSEEFAKTLNITNLMANPAAFSQRLIDVDLAAVAQQNKQDLGWDAPGYGTEVSPDLEGATDAAPGIGTAPAGRGPASGGAGGGAGGGDGFGGDGGGSGIAGAGGGRGGTSGETTPGTGSGATRQPGTEDAAPDGPYAGAGGTPSALTGGGGPSATTPSEMLKGGASAATPAIPPSAKGKRQGAASSPAAQPGDPAGPANTAPSAHQDGPAAGGATAPTDGGKPGGRSDAEAAPGAAPGPGPMLLHQLEKMQQEVHKHLQGKGETNIADLAQAIFEMKKQLLEGIQAQKALGIAYANETAITQTANQLADQVMMELIKDEYQAGKVTTQRLAHLIRRIIPEAAELKRLLPQIKRTLLAEGMAMAEYLNLIGELRNELQSEELTRILEESSDSIGLDGKDLVEEIKRNPGQAAELIYLASQIRQGGGDEAALSDILVEYVEHLGTQMAKDAPEDDPNREGHLKQVMGDIESTLLQKLSQMNVNADTLTRMEQRINERMESILDNMRVQWLQTQTGQSTSTDAKPRILTVLQTLEHHVGEDEELAGILKNVRSKVAAGEIEENNFSHIHEEISRQKQLLREQAGKSSMTEGVLSANEVMFIMEKEIARAKRYGSWFSAISLAFVSAKPTMKLLDDVLTNEMIMEAALELLATTFREVDYIGRTGKNRIMALLPTIDQAGAKKALDRVLRLLHAKPLDVDGIPVELRVAGVAAAFDEEQTPDAQRFAKQIARQLTDMVARLKNIQVLF